MDRSILAARRHTALMIIEEKSGIDISRDTLPKSPSTEIFQLFQLEKLAIEMSDLNSLEEILSKIENVQGGGEALYGKIEKALRE